MYHALIVDDESDARGVLCSLLELFCPEVTQTSEAATIDQAMVLAESHHFDIAFLDIELRRESGMDLAKKLQPYCQNIVFVTAYDSFALEAFRASALHYILKPIDPELLQEAIERIESQSSKVMPSITLTTKNEVIKLAQQDILYIQGDGNYSTFYCFDGSSYMVSRNLSHYLPQLNQNEFLRIHQSYAVKMSGVAKYLVGNGYFAVLKDGKKLPISRRKKDEFLRALQG